ncbi:hypothetical protein L6164_023700 [Bauhinia variegata]|uniref:Uncharacterized protein n=1 Tax=Bauhinia variegata TaxID=167791 RepID=A0ACB9MKE7_BAUVA|nr:hypothetical protein L6164_023700 [Bauhinia variegata]
MASAAVDLLIGKVVFFIESEASLLGNVADELREMQRELQSMRSFMVDTHSTLDESEQEKTWVAQVRDTAIMLQNIIDEFDYHKNKLKASKKSTRFFHQAIYFPQNLWIKHQVASKLKTMKTAINNISERKNRYKGENLSRETPSHVGPHDWLRIHHESPLFLRDDDVVGFDESKDKIMKLLVNEKQDHTVISIWGDGGSGKTTLVANVFNNLKTQEHFDCFAWITVSQRYGVQDIFRSMIKELCKSRNDQIPEDLSSLDSRSLVEKIVSYLQGKKYLVILDDIWSPDLWGDISIALPKGSQGSRAVLTTRFYAIASSSFGVQSHVHHIKPLNEAEALTLFCKKAFSNGCCPTNLEAIAKSLVEKCDGLPLALVALGGSMSSKKLESEWTKVDRSLNWQLSNNPELQKMKSILLLSYYDLPYRLKPCFLYCSIFPEDYLMQTSELIRLWLAEGFLEEIEGLTPEEVGETYLMELVRRSLLHAVQRNQLGLPEEFRMHDILRDLAISISANERFSTIWKDEKAIQDHHAPILAIHGNTMSNLHYNFSKVRSFFMFLSPSTKLPSGFKFLRVLDLKGSNINKVPSDIMICYNLRCLNLAETNVKELPKSIGRLCQLQTLDLRLTYIEELPSGVTRLHNLRHLLVSRKRRFVPGKFNSDLGVKVPPNICRLVNLQVLSNIEVNGDLVRKFMNLSNLRRLRLSQLTEEVQKDLCLAIETMEHLRYLVVRSIDDQTVLRLDSLSSTPPRLNILRLNGKLWKVPGWFQSLENLIELSLNWTRSQEDFLPYIEALPNLETLYLRKAYMGEKLYFGKGFQKLMTLKILDMPQLKQIVVEDGVMPSIQGLHVAFCSNLETMFGIGYLKSLEQVYFKDVSYKLQDHVLQNLEKSEHQPKVFWI